MKKLFAILMVLAMMFSIVACAETTDKPNPSSSSTPSTPSTPDQPMTYEKYIAMSGAEQQAFFESFSDPAAFIAWYNTAKAAYDAAQKDNTITGDGNIDLGDLIKP